MHATVPYPQKNAERGGVGGDRMEARLRVYFTMDGPDETGRDSAVPSIVYYFGVESVMKFGRVCIRG